MKKYLRSVLEQFPHAAAEGYRVFGWRGSYLAFCALVLRRQPFPISLPAFGKVYSWAEAMNLVDNFCLGELRSTSVENHLRQVSAPWVVDVGVNVGVTCRWWLSLTPDVRVIGVDMFQEALDFTSQRISLTGDIDRWQPLCAAVGASDAMTELRFDNPLEGTAKLDSSTGKRSRLVRVQPLDAILDAVLPERIAVLKLDIEGHAGHALSEASAILSRTDYVVVETHSEDETRSASSSLIAAGFHLIRVYGRTMWWSQPELRPADYESGALPD